jgi:tetratricopeptide (TPR) repeat protein
LAKCQPSSYADLLLRENRNNDAIEVLREAGKNDSRAQVKLAQLAKSLGNDRLFEEIKKELEGPREVRVQNGTATEFEFGELISLVLMQGNTSKAIQLARTGLRGYPQSPQLKRLLSNAYMMEFSVASESKATSEERMALLDMAMKSDPTNPLVLEKIAELVSQDKLHNENIAAFLRDQLASGNATATTHLFLAVGHLRKEQLEQAIVHLEIAVGLAPNNPIILNNLALCLARTRPSELPRAKKMIEFGLQIGGPNAELLDTYGEILVLSTDYISAIRAFEAALSINQDRPATRKRLAEAYTKVALTEMAESVSKFDSKESSTLLNPDGTVNKKSLLEESPFEKSK